MGLPPAPARVHAPHIGLVHFDPAGEAIVAPDSLGHTDGWPGYDSLEHHGVVPSDVVGDEPEDGGERLGVAADVGSAQLQDRLDVVAVEVERGRLGRIRLRRLLDASGPSLTAFVQDAGCWAPITARSASWRIIREIPRIILHEAVRYMLGLPESSK